MMSDDKHITVSIKTQQLHLYEKKNLIKHYLISTAQNGCGQKMGSECTPLGAHIIAQKIGADCQVNTVFVGRIPTGEYYHPSLAERYPERDWIVTRILWLSGTEAGKNKGDDVDTYMRYIYIHGTPDRAVLGTPGSRGCIRMANDDIVELFDLVDEGTRVCITAS